MAQKFEHCHLAGKKIIYLGRDRIFENKTDKSWNENQAWDFLEKDGWELVTVVMDKDGIPNAYFKRPFRNEGR